MVAGLLGLAVTIYLIRDAGADAVLQSMLFIGWGLIPITLFHVVPLFFSGLSWRELLPRSSGFSVLGVTWLRWIRESINTVLPAAGVSGDFVSLRLAQLRGVPRAEAAASMIVDVTVGAGTQLLFAMTGAVLLLARASDPTRDVVAWAVLAGTAIVSAGTAVFLVSQNRRLLSRSTKLAGRLVGSERTFGISAAASAIDDAVIHLYRDRLALTRASLLRFFGWAIGPGEIWLVMLFLGQPIPVADAFILDSLGAGIRAVAFVVPAQLGVLEGSFVLFGAMFGLPPETALAISFSRRVRELTLGAPGLIAWQWSEHHHLVRGHRGSSASDTG